MPVQPVPVVVGVSIPLYPMRPTKGVSLRTPAAAAEVKAARKTHVVHRKLNGDRVQIAKVHKLYTANRHGGWYNYGVENKHLLMVFPNGTMFDGEVWKKNFYPFDCMAYNGESMCRVPVEDRVSFTRELCKSAGIEWVWEVDDAWLDELDANQPKWEGVVLKQLGSPYLALGTDTQDSASWSKRKWAL